MNLAPRGIVGKVERVTPLLDKKLIFVTGKGGVGKTTTAAVVAQLAAERGRRTLVCEVDIDSAMQHIFGSGPVGFDPTQVGENLYACSLSGDESMRDFIARFVPSKRVAGLILKNKVANIFFHAAPSVLEAVILDRLAFLLEEVEPAFDTVVVDLPASGHAVTFLNVPKSMASMVAVGDLAKHLRRIATIISDPNKAEVLLVSLPDEIVINETIELWKKLHATVDTPAHTVVVNGVRAPSLREDDLGRVAMLAAENAAVDFEPLRNALGLGLYWKGEDERNLERLSEAIEGRVLTTPFVFDKGSDAELVGRLGDTLRRRLA